MRSVLLAVLFGIAGPLLPWRAQAQGGYVAVMESCEWQVARNDNVSVLVCTLTDGTRHLYLRDRATTLLQIAAVDYPDYGAFFTPLGRERLPRTWRRWAAAGLGHALERRVLTVSPCPELNDWIDHVVYAATVGWPGLTVTVWVAPNGAVCSWAR
ncbi:MAG: hypothetical protein IRZ14_21045 [Chloroflexi bacterium]|nr:hypothetical protein [Chloroflexota bacterium]